MSRLAKAVEGATCAGVAPLLLLVGHMSSQSVSGVTIEPLYRVPTQEGVFAYGRISPDGNHLAYTAQLYGAGNVRSSRIQRVLNVRDRQLVFSEPGLDGYWSPDGRRLIFISKRDDTDSVSVLELDRGTVTRGVAPAEAGDYLSWAVRDGRDLILTILNRYYYLDSGATAAPIYTVAPCGTMGTGHRPLISKQGKHVSTFVNGEVVVRDLVGCDNIIRTYTSGGKADFSFDGRFIAFHSEKAKGIGYEIRVVDLAQRAIATVGALPGSSLFPNWTRDGRLVFRYDDAHFRGFMIASGVLSAEFMPLPAAPPATRPAEAGVLWDEMFLDPRATDERLSVVLVWAPWNPHSIEALSSLAAASRLSHGRGGRVEARVAVEPTSWPRDTERMQRLAPTSLPEVRMRPGRVSRSAAANQIPAFLLFDCEVLVDSLLGTQPPEDLVGWLERRRARTTQRRCAGAGGSRRTAVVVGGQAR